MLCSALLSYRTIGSLRLEKTSSGLCCAILDSCGSSHKLLVFLVFLWRVCRIMSTEMEFVLSRQCSWKFLEWNIYAGKVHKALLSFPPPPNLQKPPDKPKLKHLKEPHKTKPQKTKRHGQDIMIMEIWLCNVVHSKLFCTLVTVIVCVHLLEVPLISLVFGKQEVW